MELGLILHGWLVLFQRLVKLRFSDSINFMRFIIFHCSSIAERRFHRSVILGYSSLSINKQKKITASMADGYAAVPAIFSPLVSICKEFKQLFVKGQGHEVMISTYVCLSFMAYVLKRNVAKSLNSVTRESYAFLTRNSYTFQSHCHFIVTSCHTSQIQNAL